MPTLNDLTGNTYGSWTVLGRAANQAGRVHWQCRCTCGAEVPVATASLVRGLSTRCHPCATRRHEHTGAVFGQWTVLTRHTGDRTRRPGSYWLCRCTCGTTTPVRGDALRTGASRSCKTCAAKNRRTRNAT